MELRRKEAAVPRAPGMAEPAAAGAVHAFVDDALGDADAVALATELARGAVHPDELAAAALTRAEAVADHLGAVAHQAPAPRRVPRQGSELDGIPTYLKDNLDVAGMPTGHGTSAFKARPARFDGRVTQQILGTGVAVLGKSRMPEFGFHASTEFADAPPTRNPWDTSRSVGGSSGGAAALVAAGVVPFAHGNDGGGSIRIPAAAAGLVGLKPTRGRYLDDEVASRMPIKLVCDGVLTRSVRDTAAFVDAMERQWRNRGLPPVGRISAPSSRRLRIGLMDQTLGPQDLDPATRQALADTAQLLESLGHRVERVALPVDERFAVDFLHHWALLALLASVGGRLVIDPDFDARRMDPFSQGLRRHALRFAPELPAAITRLRRTAQRCALLFDAHEVVLSPVITARTPPLGVLSPAVGFETLLGRLVRHLGTTPLHNMTGWPSIAVPGPVDAGGLPTSGLFTAAWGEERTLLELAFELEEARPFPRVQEPVR